jgi:alpha-glucosidase (family GH31 glycosyl hydrolase)
MQICTKGDPPRPFRYDQEAIDITRKYAKLRVALLPYLKRAARQAHERGVPMVRPLGMVYPDDPRAHEQTFEYMFGDALLVAPIYGPGDERTVYLPAGEWVDFWNRTERHRGPTELTVTVPLDRIPVFVKGSLQHPLDPG